jgi:hypothetical protein
MISSARSTGISKANASDSSSTSTILLPVIQSPGTPLLSVKKPSVMQPLCSGPPAVMLLLLLEGKLIYTVWSGFKQGSFCKQNSCLNKKLLSDKGAYTYDLV